MARPQKQGLDYFPHDTDACNDEKIEIMRTLFGNDGYAFYFIILERIYKSGKSYIDLSNNDVLATLKKRVNVRPAKFNQMLEKALEIQLFDKEKHRTSKVLTSSAIESRINHLMSDRLYRREHREFVREQTPGQTPEQTIRQTGEIKEKKIKENNNNDNGNNSLIYQIVEENFQKITGTVREQVNEVISEYGSDKVLAALKESIRRNVRTLAYASKILENERNGINKSNLPRGQPPLRTDPFKYERDKYAEHWTR